MKIEKFLIAEAKLAGVIRSQKQTLNHNPNRWAKHLAPWFEETCRKARADYKYTKRRLGKKHENTKNAYKYFKNCCSIQRSKLQFDLPDILKYKPKEFWNMLK
jgi:hypothetical protein